MVLNQPYTYFILIFLQLIIKFSQNQQFYYHLILSSFSWGVMIVIVMVFGN
jgi:hypothetical protein